MDEDSSQSNISSDRDENDFLENNLNDSSRENSSHSSDEDLHNYSYEQTSRKKEKKISPITKPRKPNESDYWKLIDKNSPIVNKTDQSLFTNETPLEIQKANEDIAIFDDPNFISKAEPIDFFHLMMPNKFFDIITLQTNIYKSQQKEKMISEEFQPFSSLLKQKVFTVEDIKGYLGMVLWFGLISNVDYQDNWSKKNPLYLTNHNKYMSRELFININKCIHLADNTADTKDPLAKIRPLIDIVIPNWSKYYYPDHILNVDETMIKFHGKFKYSQKMMDKPVDQGVKMYTLCQSSNSYCLNAFIHVADKTVEKWDGFSSTESIVLSLIKKYFNSNKLVFMDNYYTSIKLYTFLLEKNIGCVGTFRYNRIPDKSGIVVPPLKDFHTFVRTSEYNLPKIKKKIFLTLFNDSKEVYLLDSAFNFAHSIDKFDNRKKEKTLPAIVHYYNKFGHGVDLLNKMTYQYRYPHKSIKWWKPIVFHLLQISIYNAHILYNKYKDIYLSFKRFYEAIVIALIGPPRKEREYIHKYQMVQLHRLQHIDQYLKGSKRKTCFYCKVKKSMWQCMDCNVTLCIPECFNIYHTKLLGVSDKKTN